MKAKIALLFAGVALAACCSLFPLASAAVAPRSHNPVVSFNLSDLDPILSSEIARAQQPVVIEFYDALDPDTSGECKRQLDQPVDRFSAKVTMLRAEVHAQQKDFIDSARIAVCPTHLFVLGIHGKEVIGQRVWGYLSDADFQQLFAEFFAI